MRRKLGWLLFCLKYRFGLAKYGVDFWDVGDPDYDPNDERSYL